MAPTGDDSSAKSSSALTPAQRKLKELPWAERFRPKHLGQVVGNTDQIRKLAEWLRDWDDVVMKGKLKEPPPEKPEDKWKKFKPPPENLNARAVLVSGPPGIGKTSTCQLIARCCLKYNLMEFNASDERSKTAIDNMSKSLAGNRTLKFGGTGGCLERAIIIMDECDGMAGGGDKGGTQALINMIKTTKSPIICICNDRGDQQVRNLATSCLDVRFRRPDNALVVKRVKNILEGEGRKVDTLALEAIVEGCGHDIRQVLNQVQFFGAVAGSSSKKDSQVALSVFDACLRLLTKDTSGKLPPLKTEDKFDLFYIDGDMMPLMVQENYIRTYEKTGRDTVDELKNCAKAAEMIALADCMSGSFETMSSQAAIGTLFPAFLTATEGALRPAFPAWLQKRSAHLKAGRLAQEMHARLKSCNTSCSSRALTTSGYHDVLHRRLLRPLATGDVKACARLMASCNLSREFFTDQAPALRLPLGLEDGYRRIDGTVKTQLLHELQNLAAQAAPQKKRRMPGENSEGVPKRNRETGDEEADEEPGKEEVEDNGMVRPAKKKAAAKAPAAKSMKTVATDSRASLQSWIPKKKREATEDNPEGLDNEELSATKMKAGIILKFIEGHTNAVRRKVHLEDFTGPWTMF